MNTSGLGPDMPASARWTGESSGGLSPYDSVTLDASVCLMIGIISWTRKTIIVKNKKSRNSSPVVMPCQMSRFSQRLESNRASNLNESEALAGLNAWERGKERIGRGVEG